MSGSRKKTCARKAEGEGRRENEVKAKTSVSLLNP